MVIVTLSVSVLLWSAYRLIKINSAGHQFLVY